MARPTSEVPALQGGSDHAHSRSKALTEALSKAQLSGTLSQKLPLSPRARLLGLLTLILTLTLTSSRGDMSYLLTWAPSFYTAMGRASWRVWPQAALCKTKDGHPFTQQACRISRKTWILKPYRNEREQSLSTSSCRHLPQ